MSLMVIGADHLGNSIKSNVQNLGFDEIKHLSGRKKGEFRQFELSTGIDLVLVLTDYIHHSAMKMVKKEAKMKNTEIVFARRSWASIYMKLKQRGWI